MDREDFMSRHPDVQLGNLTIYAGEGGDGDSPPPAPPSGPPPPPPPVPHDDGPIGRR